MRRSLKANFSATSKGYQANQAKDGLMAIAEGGTIFLDEVGELPVDLQTRSLAVIQGKIRPVGSLRRIPINIQFWRRRIVIWSRR